MVIAQPSRRSVAGVSARPAALGVPVVTQPAPRARPTAEVVDVRRDHRVGEALGVAAAGGRVDHAGSISRLVGWDSVACASLRAAAGRSRANARAIPAAIAAAPAMKATW